MKAARLALLVCFAAAAATAAQVQDGKLTFSAEEQALCARQGGCELVTRQYLQELVRRAAEAGAKACRNST